MEWRLHTTTDKLVLINTISHFKGKVAPQVNVWNVDHTHAVVDKQYGGELRCHLSMGNSHPKGLATALRMHNTCKKGLSHLELSHAR